MEDGYCKSSYSLVVWNMPPAGVKAAFNLVL